MYNKVILVGNLTRDLEFRYLQSGTAVGNTGIATNRKYKGSDGEQKEEVMFIDLTFFGRTAEIANQYLKKGSKILVEGRLKLDSWQDQNGAKRSKHSITVDSMQMLDSRGSDNSNGANHGGYGNGGYNNQNSYSAPTTPQNHGGYVDRNVTDEKGVPQQPTQPEPNIPEIDIDDDEIPF